MISNFYNNLFGIEITILGIITTGIFVFIQILHSNFSHKDLTLSLRRISIFIYFLLSVLLIAITGIGALHFAISPHDLFPQWNLGVKTVFESDVALISIFIGLLLSTPLGFYIIFKSIKLLNPLFLMQRHLAGVKSESVKRFLYNRYGVPEPYPPINIFYTVIGVEETEEEKNAKEAKVNAQESKFQEDSKKCELLKKEAENAPQVFEGFENLLIRAISQGDRGTVKNGLSKYESTISEIVSVSEESFPVRHLATYVRENLKITLESCRKHNTQSFAPQIIRTSYAISTSLMEKHSEVVDEILKEWKSQADIALADSDKLLFRAIIKGYQDIGDIIFKREDLFADNRNNLLNIIFRHLGWIAERLLTQKGIEEKPLMYDDDYEDEFGIIYNSLFHFDHKYSYDRPNAHPLIFFDAIHCLFDGLLEVYKQSKEEKITTINKRGSVKDWLFSCVYVYASFATKALAVSNGDGVSLAGVRLRQMYGTAELAKEEDLSRHILEHIVRLAIQSAMNPEKLVGDSFGVGNVVKDLEEIIIGSQYEDTVRNSVFDSYLKLYEGDYKKKHAYIKALGVKMGTDFGLSLSN